MIVRPTSPSDGPHKTHKTHSVKAESDVKMPEGIENIKPSKPPKGVDLSKKDTSEIAKGNKTHMLSRRSFASQALREKNVSALPPESDDALDAIAEQFTKKTEHELSGPRVKGAKATKKRKWQAGSPEGNLSAKLVATAMHRISIR